MGCHIDLVCAMTIAVLCKAYLYAALPLNTQCGTHLRENFHNLHSEEDITLWPAALCKCGACEHVPCHCIEPCQSFSTVAESVWLFCYTTTEDAPLPNEA